MWKKVIAYINENKIFSPQSIQAALDIKIGSITQYVTRLKRAGYIKPKAPCQYERVRDIPKMTVYECELQGFEFSGFPGKEI